MSKAVDKPEIPWSAAWRKSRHSLNHGACVEVATGDRGVLIRDSANATGAFLHCDRRAWSAFTSAVRSSEVSARVVSVSD